jgi:fructuronate reductase
VHLGLGNFFRAHQARYTELAPDGDEWGIAAFAGRGERMAHRLQEQDGVYTLVTRGPRDDAIDLVAAIAAAYPAAAHERWLTCFAATELACVTITVTEHGYLAAPDGGADRANPALRRDIEVLRDDLRSAVTTAPARLVAGLAARRGAGGGPIAVVPCDNVPDNGALVRRVLDDVARLVEPALADWIAESVCFASSMVDRITPPATPADIDLVADRSGWRDECVVVTEQFSEWVLTGLFPAGRPRWDEAGVTLTDDIAAAQRRKLWLLNGAHSGLAYLGLLRGLRTVAEAAADPTCQEWMRRWWAEAIGELAQAESALTTYCEQLLARFSNPRIGYPLVQVGADGSTKLAIRILPVLRRYRDRGQLPEATVTAIAAWMVWLGRAGAELIDPRQTELTALATGPVSELVQGALAMLAPDLADDAELVASMRSAVERWRRHRPDQ